MPRKAKDQAKALEQTVIRSFRDLENYPRKLLLACSGGVDSVVLLEVLFRIRRLLKLELVVAYVHHGPGAKFYRNKAQALVQMLAKSHNLEFLTNLDRPKKALKSEAEFREFRWQHLQAWRAQHDCQSIVVAHHLEDLLETRMMRLIRGTGAQGFSCMAHMSFRDKIFRPLLLTRKRELMAYAELRELPFVADPSNFKTDAFRNWIRKWLAGLERRHPGGTRNLIRSLSDLAQELEMHSPSPEDRVMTAGAINRREFVVAARTAKKSALARYCVELGVKNYTQGHIQELLRRLDVAENDFTFELLNCVWRVSPDLIRASRV
jgi:tRNA(Ile)-lysidine synthase